MNSYVLTPLSIGGGRTHVNIVTFHCTMTTITTCKFQRWKVQNVWSCHENGAQLMSGIINERQKFSRYRWQHINMFMRPTRTFAAKLSTLFCQFVTSEVSRSLNSEVSWEVSYRPSIRDLHANTYTTSSKPSWLNFLFTNSDCLFPLL